MHRVVITGMGGYSALGHNWHDIKQNLIAQKSATRVMDEWLDIDGMYTQLAAPIQHADLQSHYKRKEIRTMGPVSLYALYATEQALAMANIERGNPILKEGRTGVAYGSSFGSTAPMKEWSELLFNRTIRKVTATSYIRLMGHTTAVNLGLFYGLQGRIIPSSTACTSGSLAIGYAAEAISTGQQDIMIAGGAEELCPSMAAVFDVLYATSTKNDSPGITPAPFDANRDGIVVGEGAATLILENYDHAVARGATIYAELVGFGTNTDGVHVTQPSAYTMEKALRLAIQHANIKPEQIGFVNGHGTATDHGDIAESQATFAVVGDKAPIHSLKSYYGHTLGACGALEAWLGIEMMREGWFAPTINLKNIDPRCAALDYVKDTPRKLEIEYLMSNNFAFGGINTSLIFKRI